MDSVMKYTTPEACGVKSSAVQAYLKALEDQHLSTHDVILVRGNNIFFEKYYEPFGPEFLHRMYSSTKSFMSLAIGFLVDEGKINLDDPIEKYFPEELKDQPDQNMHRQTIRHMLMMATCKSDEDWFKARTDDRVKFYFSNHRPESRPSGTIFEYDSTGSFVLCALVERITGMTEVEYLRQKLFRKIGVSEEAHMLKCPGGHSWGDSAMLCKARDFMLTARFVLNGGSWNGEQILSRDYVEAATSCQIATDYLQEPDDASQFGYGYQFWRTYEDSFYFNGLGCQFGVCVPHKDMILIYNGDNQGRIRAKNKLIKAFFDLIVDTAADEALPEDPAAVKALNDYAAPLKLAMAYGPYTSPFTADCCGHYVMGENPIGLKTVDIDIDGDVGHFRYVNAQGEKDLIFGLGHNEFGMFPEEGYSDEVGGAKAPGHRYKCCASAGWRQPRQLYIKVQIIDNYFGTLDITIGFSEDGGIGIYMLKAAEDFLDEYQGFAGGRKE